MTQALATGPDTDEWPLWSTTARLVVTDPGALGPARTLVDAILADVDRACNRFRADSELSMLPGTTRDVAVTPMLAELIGTALDAARDSAGAVDPTIGSALARLGYDRDLSHVDVGGRRVPVALTPAPGWQRVRLEGHRLTMPAGVRLDLGATGKAYAADLCASAVAAKLGVGVLVSLGGDIATAGPGPDGGWRVLVLDQPGDTPCTVALPAGAAIATSSTVSRTWRAGDRVLHHVLDPTTCQPAARVWRSVTVAARTCVLANTFSTASLVRGADASRMLRDNGISARLVRPDGTVQLVGGWPVEVTG